MHGTQFALDVTLEGREAYAFVPLEAGEVLVWGMTFVQDRCPGELVAVVSEHGQESVERWVEQNPDWHERFRKEGT